MLLLKRTLPAASGTLAVIALASLAWAPLFLPLSLLGWVLLPSLASMVLCGVRRESREWWRLVSTPMLCTAGWGLLAIFVENAAVLWGMSVLGGVAVWWYLEQLFQFLFVGSYRPYGLERAAFLLQTLGMIGWGVGVYSLHVFMHEPLWGSMLIWCVVAILTTDAALWFGKVEGARRRAYTWWSAAVLLALFFAYAWLPVHVFVQGVSMAVWWAALVSVYKADARERLSGPTLHAITAGAGVALVALLVTARWV